jgi:four helix bundle protein
MGTVTKFTDLVAWQEGHKLVLNIYSLTKKFPKDELFSLTNQMRRAVVSITSNIAEGFSRYSKLEKRQFYTISKGSLTEIENQLIIARDIGYINDSQYSNAEGQTIVVGKLITSLLKYINSLP